MLVLELRVAGSNPGRWDTREVVVEVVVGKGDGTVSGARSVSAKKPPSMWGRRQSEVMSVWINGDSEALGEAVKAGTKGEVVV
jgi:hypothetical protein